MHPAAAADGLRDQLVAQSFTDDGSILRGPVAWQQPDGRRRTATISVALPDTYPFAPPRVTLDDPGDDLQPSFHLDRGGVLCLWEDRHPVDEAPWLHADRLLERARGWIEHTAAGWPDDDSCDLERYLPVGDHLVVYDSDQVPLDVPVRLATTANGAAIRLSHEPVHVGSRQRRRALARGRQLGIVHDLGAIRQPIRGWTDLVRMLPATTVEHDTRLIRSGHLAAILLRYRHGAGHGSLALRTRSLDGTIQITAVESADIARATRTLRAGPDAAALPEISTAVVGVGAIGSFTAVGLFRSGFRSLHLHDDELLRPGNVVRHAAGLSHVGRAKTDAVHDLLADIDPDVDHVDAGSGIHQLQEALDLLRRHRMVIDATGSARTTSFLVTAAELLGEDAGILISVCVQQDGDLARVDRWPLRDGEQHLPAPPPRPPTAPELHEHGCGSPVSPTPPHAVQAAATLAVRTALDEATGRRRLPATLIQDLDPDPLPHEPAPVPLALLAR